MPTALPAVACVPSLLAAAVLYFPTTVGATRVLQITAGATAEMTETVTKAESRAGVHTVTVERRRSGPPGGVTTLVLEVSARGVYRVDDPGPGGRAVPLLKLGLEGDRWVTPVAGPDGRPVEYTSALGRAGEVTVPAGTYRAVRVDRSAEVGGRRLTSSTWYAPGVGPVKVVLRAGDGSEQTTVLKSFSPGK